MKETNQTDISEQQDIPAEGVENTAAENAVGEPPVDRVQELEKALEEERARTLRALADIDNLRKRHNREKDDLRLYATGSLLEDLLPTLDNLQLGLKTADQHPEAKSVADGFRMVAQQLQQTLAKHGLESVHPQGEVFDPNLHECVAHNPSEDVAEDHVISVMRIGYTLNGRLLRPASVIVSSGEPQSAEKAD